VAQRGKKSGQERREKKFEEKKRVCPGVKRKTASGGLGYHFFERHQKEEKREAKRKAGARKSEK